MANIDYNDLLNEIWGWGSEEPVLPFFTLASNILVGTNPPYSATDFYTWFPQYGGVPKTPLGTLDGNTGNVTAVSDMTSLAAGQSVAGIGVPSGTVISSVNVAAKTLVLSQNTTYAGTVTLTVYVVPIVPLPVLNAYIYLATNSILKVRYCELWPFVMALYIAHYLTLWQQGQAGGPGSTPGQVATAGLAMGIKIAKSVGDVSVSSKPLDTFEDWGSYALTSYGQQLITYAMAVGSGPVLLW
jgi:hypothetical protein